MNSIGNLDGKVAVVTGSAGGIGSATCQLLAQAGAKIVATDINLAAAEKTVQQLIASGNDAIAIQHDVTSEDDWNTVIEQTIDHYKKMDILVNNAGVIIEGECKDLSLESWNTVINVNLNGVFLGVRSAINAMIDNKDMCSIINVASGGGIIGNPNCSSYSASKAGVRLLTKAVAIECGRNGYNIRVNTVCPGNTVKGMNNTSVSMEELAKFYPLGHLAETSDIAKGILFLASDDSSFITGTDLVIDGGLLAGVPVKVELDANE